MGLTIIYFWYFSLKNLFALRRKLFKSLVRLQLGLYEFFEQFIRSGRSGKLEREPEREPEQELEWGYEMEREPEWELEWGYKTERGLERERHYQKGVSDE